MGIIGLGAIGFAVAERAAAFGIRLQSLARPGRSAYAVSRAEELGIVMCDSMQELVSSSDIVTLHVPSGADTRHLVDAAFLAQMRKGAILLNTSRGDVVDEAALLEALDARACARASTFSPTSRAPAKAPGTHRSPGTPRSSPPTTSARPPRRHNARSRRASPRSSTRSWPARRGTA